ncbi:MAG: hypothetical protein DLM55_11905 [Acidimicrobiales bacterium]|nr:MAG: hypothetical protein DLM55_11905 [Acidimicrobiales bacterium]
MEGTLYLTELTESITLHLLADQPRRRRVANAENQEPSDSTEEDNRGLVLDDRSDTSHSSDAADLRNPRMTLDGHSKQYTFQS